MFSQAQKNGNTNDVWDSGEDGFGKGSPVESIDTEEQEEEAQRVERKKLV